MKTVKNPYPLCHRDGFPMVKIGNKQQCVAEYLDKHIGQKKIIDTVQHDEITYYVFENGWELPLLCFCCGKPLVIAELEKLRRDMRGRRLESMAVGSVGAPDDGEFLEFQLEFSHKGFETQGVVQSIAPEAAARILKPSSDRSTKPLFPKRKRAKDQKKRGFG